MGCAATSIITAALQAVLDEFANHDSKAALEDVLLGAVALGAEGIGSATEINGKAGRGYRCCRHTTSVG